MAKQILSGVEARNALKRGVDALANSVGTTLGPRGYNVTLGREFASPIVTHDGVTVAKDIELEDPYENIGALLLKEAAIRTNEVVGDGTTTSIILAQAVVAQGLTAIQGEDGLLLKGENAMNLKTQLEVAAEKVLAEISKLSKQITTQPELARVATISSSDTKIGEVIAEALFRVGKDGAVTVEDGDVPGVTVEYKEGIEIDSGYVSPHFINIPEKSRSAVDDPLIFITDETLSSVDELFPLLQKVSQESKNLVIIARGVEGEALRTLIVNKERGMNFLAVEAPGIDRRRTQLLEDLAVLTGGRVVSVAEAEIKDFGRAKKVTSTQTTTTIVGGLSNKSTLAEHIKKIKSETVLGYEKELQNQRVGRLSGGVAVIAVGAFTDIELKEKRYRVEDALSAAKAAISDGIVPGGETALLRASGTLADSPAEQILKKALREPFSRLMENSGLPASRADEVLSKPAPFGVDARSGDLVDLYERGIIDPALVAKTALSNALSVANAILTTACIVTDIPKKDDP